MELNNVDIKSRPININCLQWSKENHISVISPSGIDIFIPSYRSRYTRDAIVICQDSSDRNPIKINDFSSTLIKDIPEVFKCFTWSPIGCSIIQSCLFVAITSRFHVAIYGPKDGPLQRDWIEVENMSPRLLQHYTDQNSENITDVTLLNKLQSISVSWSPLCFPKNFDHFSVIAIGSKADVSSFVTASDDGSVYMWRVTISLIPVISSGIENIKLQASITLHATLSQADNRPASIMKWYECNNAGERLAIVKGLKIYVWTSTRLPLINTDLEPPKMFKIPLSKGTIVAMIWNYDGTQLYIFNNEGNNLTLDISGTEIDINEFTTKYINDVLATKLESPDALYVTDKFEVSYVTFCPSEEQSNSELVPSLVTRLKNMLEDAYILERKSTNYLMWDLLEYCVLENEFDKNNSLLHQLDKACWDCYNKYTASSSIGELSDNTEFNTEDLTDFSLIGIIMKWKNVLYRNRSLNALRLLVHIYNSTTRLEAPSGLQLQLSPAFEDCLKRIEKYFLKQVLSTTVDCIKCGVVINSGKVLSLLIEMCCIIVLLDDDNELLKLAKFLYDYLSTLQEKVEIVGSLETEQAWTSQLISSKKNKKTKKTPTRATCPASIIVFLIQLIHVSFMRGPTGRCTKGHVWDLCSITLSIVADKHVRSCSNCNRKILVASDPYNSMDNSVDEQSIASSIVVKAIFETCEKCFYCGGNFIFRQT
ncbi:3297_t:CDS:10 [Cetraspora pellucida]|uniref:3297_t:CDS:1 n=1 Tax=Cetraspora pellucida TaxID=1433469 RepID=A0A9N8VFR8_9GLOM|nr:3297_t:CDS:10 [Cetraspora pellucida]